MTETNERPRRRYQTTDDVLAQHGLTRESFRAPQSPRPAVRAPLTTSQHILHLLLTVFTAGLWAPVWLYLAIQGNRRPAG